MYFMNFIFSIITKTIAIIFCFNGISGHDDSEAPFTDVSKQNISFKNFYYNIISSHDIVLSYSELRVRNVVVRLFTH